MEVGSFDGLWARDVHQRYGSRILIFEPVESFCRKMRGSIPTVGGGGGRAVEILPYGLSDHDHEDFFYLQGQGTSFNRRLADAQQVKVQLRDGVKVLDELNITNVDLVKINIEGGEYDLLEHYIEYERLSVFKNLLIQFHRIQGAEERLTTLRERMAETHELSWRYEGVFESWRRRDA